MNVHQSATRAELVGSLRGMALAPGASDAMVRFEAISKVYPAYRDKPGHLGHRLRIQQLAGSVSSLATVSQCRRIWSRSEHSRTWPGWRLAPSRMTAPRRRQIY
jgi:hypothetical protein